MACHVTTCNEAVDNHRLQSLFFLQQLKDKSWVRVEVRGRREHSTQENILPSDNITAFEHA